MNEMNLNQATAWAGAPKVKLFPRKGEALMERIARAEDCVENIYGSTRSDLIALQREVVELKKETAALKAELAALQVDKTKLKAADPIVAALKKEIRSLKAANASLAKKMKAFAKGMKKMAKNMMNTVWGADSDGEDEDGEQGARLLGEEGKVDGKQFLNPIYAFDCKTFPSITKTIGTVSQPKRTTTKIHLGLPRTSRPGFQDRASSHKTPTIHTLMSSFLKPSGFDKTKSRIGGLDVHAPRNAHVPSSVDCSSRGAVPSLRDRLGVTEPVVSISYSIIIGAQPILTGRDKAVDGNV
ncbi:hypothetical protein QBC44DRAFT_308992 [Cladorrhinum sp. PSN332]|nr:hypothetical protein QBC44DRAFT_308992 [Cladorrhinum sp. PSN332]